MVDRNLPIPQNTAGEGRLIEIEAGAVRGTNVRPVALVYVQDSRFARHVFRDEREGIAANIVQRRQNLRVRQMLKNLPNQTQIRCGQRIFGNVQGLEGNAWAGECDPVVLDQLGDNVDSNTVGASLLYDSAADVEVPTTQVSDTANAFLVNEVRDPGAIFVGYCAA